MATANAKTVNQNSIGSVDKINNGVITENQQLVDWGVDDAIESILDDEKSVYRIVTEVQHYEENVDDDDNYQEAWSDTYKSIVVADCEEEARDIIEDEIQTRFFNNYENTFDEITKLSHDEIHAELCHLDRDTIIKRAINDGVILFKSMRG